MSSMIPPSAPSGIIDLIGLAFDRDGEVVDDLALGVQRLVQVAARVPFLQGGVQLGLCLGILLNLLQIDALAKMRLMLLEPVGMHLVCQLHDVSVVYTFVLLA